MSIIVRRIRSDEADAFKTIRLAALQDSPSSFGSTFAREERLTPDEWAARARAGAEGSDRTMLFALLDGNIVGLGGGVRSELDPSVIDLVSMWTSPSARRSGVGRALIGAVVAWSRESEASAVDLWVTQGNEPARRLYESCGFVETGDSQPLPSDPSRSELHMRLSL